MGPVQTDEWEAIHTEMKMKSRAEKLEWHAKKRGATLSNGKLKYAVLVVFPMKLSELVTLHKFLCILHLKYFWLASSPRNSNKFVKSSQQTGAFEPCIIKLKVP